MPDKKQIERALEELSASQGGSLVKEVVKSRMKREPVLFISLGGLGGQTLEYLKRLIQKEYEENPHVAFLAVDTSQKDLNDRKGLDLDEKFPIYDPTCVTLPSHRPAVVEKWINPQFPKDNLKSTGAEGTRQVARLMLCGTSKYQALKSRIQSAIADICSGLSDGDRWVRINIIAGISGGTGSGTIVDVAYMIHDIMKGMGVVTYDLRGFLYLPDAQKHVPEILNDPATWSNLQRNGYAALKEIDYFMTNGTADGGKTVYSLELPGGLSVKSSRKIFEVGDCILVSSVTTRGAVTNLSEIIVRFASYIAYIFTDMSNMQVATNNGAALPMPGGPQDILSTLCNLGKAILPTWKTHNIKGVEKDDPNWAGYHYSVIGYSSMYIPRDEIFAYCANTVFERMYEDWHDVQKVNQAVIDQVLAAKRLDSLDSVFQNVRRIVNQIVKVDYRIRENDPAYPEVITYLLKFGKTKNLDATEQEAANRARLVHNSLNSQATLEKIIETIADEILGQVKGYFDLYGPFFAIAMISGLKDSGILGFLQRIDGYKADIAQKEAQLRTRANTAQAAMQDERQNRENDSTPTQEETEEFISLCEKYTSACVDCYIIQKMNAILDGVYAKLNEENTSTYEVYTTTMEVLAEMLHRDSIFATDVTRKENGKGETFYFDAIGFKKSQEMRNKFLKLFESVIDDSHAQQLAEEFKANMFSASTRDIWKQAGEDRKEFAKNIRKIFQDFFGQYTQDTLEKFVVLANCDLKRISVTEEITPERLTEIWEATPDSSPQDFALRNDLINSAADSIYAKLSGSSSIMMRSSISMTHIDEFPSNSLICLIDSMRLINAAMKTLHPEATYVDVDREFKSSITMFEMRSGVPAATIEGMNEFAAEYYASSKTPATRIGRHMDEGKGKWDYLLPEIYGCDADYFFSVKKPVVDPLGFDTSFDDLKVYNRIKECFRAGLHDGWIAKDDPDNPMCYCMYKVKKVHDDYKYFKKELSDELANGSFVNIWSITKQMNSGIDVEEIGILPANAADSDLDLLSYPENDYEIYDVHRVIRKSMDLMRTLFDCYDLYQKTDSIISVFNNINAEYITKNAENQRMDALNEDIGNFTKMFCYDLITFDEVKETWMYRKKTSSPYDVFVTLNQGMLDLDKRAKYYLAFVKGYLERKDEIKKVLAVYSSPKAPQKIYDDVKKFLESDMMTDPFEDDRNKNFEEAVSMSVYKDSYSYPYVANGVDSTYKNLKLFYSKFYEYLKQFLPTPSTTQGDN